MCSSDKSMTPRRCYADEAETPIIYFADEMYFTNKVKKRNDRFVDPFELKPVEENNLGAPSSVSFEIVGTIHCIRQTLDTIPENEQQNQASVDPFKTKTYAAGQENGFAVSSSPTSIARSFDYASPGLAPMRLFPGNDDDIGDAFNKTVEEGDFETFPFEGVNFEEDNLDLDVNKSGAATDTADDESLELWVDSVSTMNGFIKTEDFEAQDWDDEAE